MGAATFTATDGERDMARIGIEMQAEAAGLDFQDEKVRHFLNTIIETTAAHLACERFLQASLDRVTEQGHWAPGGCTYKHQPEENNVVNS